MNQYRFSKELYSKVALIKAAYNFTDNAYIHLDADDCYYYVTIETKRADCQICEKDFINEILTQSVRHEVYQQTKNIRELLMARAMATSVIVDDALIDEQYTSNDFEENDILKDWFAANEKVEG
jgi:His-Xaa-Ser system protein HxsD